MTFWDNHEKHTHAATSAAAVRASLSQALLLIAIVIIGLFAMPHPLRAHGAMDLQIQAATEAISQDTNNAGLYLKRGELYRLHLNFDEAHLDFQTALRLSTNTLTVTHLALARLYLDLSWPRSALASVDTFLASHPDHAEGYTLRAHALQQMQEPLAAARELTRAIELHLSPGPELFIDRARAYAMAGEDYLAQAVASLDDGIRLLGPLVTLQLPAIDFELDRRHYDGALQRLDLLAAQSPRKESWLKRRGEILLEAKRPEEARRAFEQALDALRSLPGSRRQVPAMMDLEKSLRQYLAELSAPDAEPSL